MTSTQPNPVQTTDAGIPVQSDTYSLTVGAGGPILLQDSYLIEQMANFNRERIKERQPHAKGSGAFAVGGISGGVFNPAVALGGAAAGLFGWSSIWVYLVVQLAAGIAAGLTFLALNPGDK